MKIATTKKMATIVNKDLYINAVDIISVGETRACY